MRLDMQDVSAQWQMQQVSMPLNCSHIYQQNTISIGEVHSWAEATQ